MSKKNPDGDGDGDDRGAGADNDAGPNGGGCYDDASNHTNETANSHLTACSWIDQADNNRGRTGLRKKVNLLNALSIPGSPYLNIGLPQWELGVYSGDQADRPEWSMNFRNIVHDNPILSDFVSKIPDSMRESWGRYMGSVGKGYPTVLSFHDWLVSKDKAIRMGGTSITSFAVPPLKQGLLILVIRPGQVSKGALMLLLPVLSLPVPDPIVLVIVTHRRLQRHRRLQSHPVLVVNPMVIKVRHA